MKQITINDLGKVITGHTPPTNETKYYGDYMPFIKPTDISKLTRYTYKPEQYYSEEAAKKYANSLIPKGSTLVVCIGTIGEKITQAHTNLFTNQSINSIIPNDNFDKDYVYYLLKYNLGNLKALNKGTASGREFVSKSAFLNMALNVHENLSTQKRIAEILSGYDDLIENNLKQISLLEESAARLYKHFFSSPKKDNGKGEIIKLKDICPIITGKKDANYADNNGKYPFFTCSQQPLRCNNYSFDASAVLLAGNGDLNVKLYRGKFEAYQRTYVLIPNKEEYLFALYHTLIECLNELKAKANGSTIKFITLSILQNIEIKIPSKEILNKFNEIRFPIQQKLETLHKSIELYRESRDLLLPKLMSGELQV
ncbi:MAG: restriction endonuclease subunit S [Bacteroidales bacterium]|nr:restriction endonuclease subunit S [Bacteroidales bacterium]